MTAETRSVEERCDDLFAAYPLALQTAEGGSLMTLILPGPVFAMIARWDAEAGGSTYVLSVEERDSLTLEQAAATGVPLPRPGTLLGYAAGDRITALVVFYTDNEPLPAYSVMPNTAEHADRWPPFTGEPVVGRWLWDCVEQDRLINLGPVLASAPGAVFWAPTGPEIGSDCCVVATGLEAEYATLPNGVFAYSELLRTDRGVIPSLEALLARPDLTDLASRFGRYA